MTDKIKVDYDSSVADSKDYFCCWTNFLGTAHSRQCNKRLRDTGSR